MEFASEQKPYLEVMKGNAIPLSTAHRELVQIFIDYLRRLPRLTRNQDGTERVGTRYTDPYSPLIALLLNYFSARDFGSAMFAKKYELSAYGGLPDEVRNELLEWFGAARFVDPLTERRRAVARAEEDRRSAGERWNYYVEARQVLGLKPAGAPWNIKKEEIGNSSL
jgi:hypothetical protein